MLICMRTTLVLDDRLVKQAKREAARRGTTLGAIVDEALRMALAAAPASAPPHYRVPTFGGRRRVEHEPSDLAEALLEDDRASLAR